MDTIDREDTLGKPSFVADPAVKVIRQDPQPDKSDVVESTGTVPEHQAGAIEGIIQDKANPDAPIVERAPNEQDLAEGKITPQAVEKVPEYDGGVTHDDVLQGKVSPTAVRERVESVDEDREMNDMITFARNRTQLARLNRAEVGEVFQALKAEGYVISRGPNWKGDPVDRFNTGMGQKVA